MLIPFEETGSGVKILHVQPVLDGESTSYSSPFSNTGFTLNWYESKPSDSTIKGLTTSNVTFTECGDYLILQTPKKSGWFILKNIKIADTLTDNSHYEVNVHLADSALNGSPRERDASLSISADSTAPCLKRIFINRLIARTLPGESTSDSYWISKDDFNLGAGTSPDGIEVTLTIEETASGVQTVVFGGDLCLTDASVITCDALTSQTLEKVTDYSVSSDYKTITLVSSSTPRFRKAATPEDSSVDFTVKITNFREQAEKKLHPSLSKTLPLTATQPQLLQAYLQSQTTRQQLFQKSTLTLPLLQSIHQNLLTVAELLKSPQDQMKQTRLRHSQVTQTKIS